MVDEPLKMKKKDQVLFDEQEAIRLQAQFDKEERIAREKEEVNADLIAQWNDIQEKVETDYELAQRLQAEEQEELTIEEKSKLFQQLLEKRRKHFAAKRAEERRNRPPTKAQQRSIILKRAGDELEQENAKKQKVDAEKDTEQETAELQKLVEIVPNKEEVAIDAIPIATKPSSIVDWKIVKEGKISFFQIIRSSGSAKRYSSFIQILRDFNKEDLETLWKLVKAKHGYTRPEEGYEIVLWGDLKTMFEPNVEDMHYPHLDNGIYNVVDRVMSPLALKQTQKPQSNRGMPKACHSISSLFAHQFGSLSHHGDDDEDDGTSRASTPSPISFINSLSPLNYQRYDIPTSYQQGDDLLFECQTALLNQT
ncbi:hypothetical protein Tco_0493219 [Tanacetum coccineum]